MLEYLCDPRRPLPAFQCSCVKINIELSEVLRNASFPEKKCERTLIELSGQRRKSHIEGLLNFPHLPLHLGQGSPVGMATDYGLDGPGIEFRWGRGFSHPSRLALGPTQLFYNVYRGFPGGKAAGAWC
jgi:hypothetical protein